MSSNIPDRHGCTGLCYYNKLLGIQVPDQFPAVSNTSVIHSRRQSRERQGNHRPCVGLCHHYRKMGQDEAFNQILVLQSSNHGLFCVIEMLIKTMLFFNFSMKRVVRPKHPHQCFWKTLKLPKMTTNHAWASAITIEKMEFPTLEMCLWIQNIDRWIIIYPLSRKLDPLPAPDLAAMDLIKELRRESFMTAHLLIFSY